MKLKSIIMIMAAISIVLLCCSCGSNEGGATADSAASASDAQKEEEKTVELKTPYAVLKIPESYEGAVTHKEEGEDPYVLSFYRADDNSLMYSISFGKKAGSLLGTLKLGDRNLVLYADFAKLKADDISGSEIQDGVHVILDNLIKDYDFVAGAEVPYEDNSVFTVETKTVGLQYPAKWKKQIETKVTDDSASFICDKTELFTFYFGVEKGTFIGTYNGTDVYLVTPEFDEKKLGKDKLNQYLAMQDDVNVTLEALRSDENFKKEK